MNECLIGYHSCNPLTESCVNTPGSYTCQPLDTFSKKKSAPIVQECPEGFGYDLKIGQCLGKIPDFFKIILVFKKTFYLDIDECLVGFHNCSVNQQCINKLGGFVCKSENPSCIPGFKLDPGTDKCIGIRYLSLERLFISYHCFFYMFNSFD